MAVDPKRILIVYQHHGEPNEMRLTTQWHLRFLEASDVPHEIVYYNTADDAPTWYGQNKPSEPPDRLRNKRFDVIIFFYSILGYKVMGSFFYEWKKTFDWFRDMEGLKIAMPQDDFDCPAILDEWLFDWNISIVLTTLKPHVKELYPIMHDKAEFYECYPGYIHEEIARKFNEKILPIQDREGDIFYRARELMYYFGSYGQLKYRIADRMRTRAEELGFICNISTRFEDVIMGERWLDTLAAHKATIGVEGGVSAINWRDEIRSRENIMRNINPGLTFEEFKERMDPDWDNHPLLTLSPRHLEAVTTKTCQILVEGNYQGVLVPEKHYIPLKSDFSNLDEILGKLRDYNYMQQMADCAYEDIYLSGKYSYRVFAERVEQAILDYERKSH